MALRAGGRKSRVAQSDVFALVYAEGYAVWFDANVAPSAAELNVVYPPIVYLSRSWMSHTIREKQKLLNRVRRIRGQLDAIERALEEEQGCAPVLQQITSCRGAMNGLLAIVLEDHIRTHLTEVDDEHEHAEGSAKEQLIEVVHSYFK